MRLYRNIHNENSELIISDVCLLYDDSVSDILHIGGYHVLLLFFHNDNLYIKLVNYHHYYFHLLLMVLCDLFGTDYLKLSFHNYYILLNFSRSSNRFSFVNFTLNDSSSFLFFLIS